MAFKSSGDASGANHPQIEPSQEYQDWRKTIFALPFDRDDPTPDPKRIESVIMDMGTNTQETPTTPGAYTLKVFFRIATFYRTSGENVHDVGRQQPKVAQAIGDIFRMAGELQPRAQPTREVSLPAPGVVQFFFLTHSGRSVFAAPLQEVQQAGHPFLPMLERFTSIRQAAEQILEERRALQAHTSQIGGLYVLVFTPETMDSDSLQALTREAANRLKTKNVAFKQRFEGKPSDARFEIHNIQFAPATHTPKIMDRLMSEWLATQHHVTFKPKADENYFFHGARSPQGKQVILLFYFDFE